MFPFNITLIRWPYSVSPRLMSRLDQPYFLVKLDSSMFFERNPYPQINMDFVNLHTKQMHIIILIYGTLQPSFTVCVGGL